MEGRGLTAIRVEIRILIHRQSLEVWEQGRCLDSYTISTATNGAGELFGSEQTPRGHHTIRAKIGAGLPENSVFVGRRPTGELYSDHLGEKEPERDWILSRILWLSGCEPGVNQLGAVDTMRRYIYIHGTPDSEPMGVPGSHGCIRMRNRDVMRLFDRVPVGTRVEIKEQD